MATIEGKCLILIRPKRRLHTKYITLHYHDAHLCRIAMPSAGELHKSSVIESTDIAAKYVSVIYISRRLIISATWIRHIPSMLQKEASFDNNNNGIIVKNKNSDELAVHESVFQFDKAFAQEIKYLFAELDFDLYMCRDKQNEIKQRQIRYEKEAVWRFKVQKQTIVYYVRGDGSHAAVYMKDYHDFVKANEKQGDCLTVEDYLKLCYDEQSKDITVEEYLKLCNAQHSPDVSVEEYLKGFEVEESTDVSVEDYLKLCYDEQSKDITVEEYLKLCNAQHSPDVSVEEYLKGFKKEESNDVSVEDYLRICNEEQLRDMTVEEYLRKCIAEKNSDTTVEEYLKTFENKISEDISVEDFLRKCHEEQESGITVENYLLQFKENGEDDMSVEDYLKQCESKEDKDISVEEYLHACYCEGLEDMPVERYIKKIKEQTDSAKEMSESQEICNEDITVEEYLKQCQAKFDDDYSDELERKGDSDDITVEQYLHLCEKEGALDMSVEEYLAQFQNEAGDDVTVEVYIQMCQNKRSQDITVEEYLAQFQLGPRDISIEDYLRTFERKRSEDITVEEYLRRCIEENAEDISVEDYIRQFKKENSCEVSVEEYLAQCHANEENADVSVEEYLRRCNEEQIEDLKQFGDDISQQNSMSHVCYCANEEAVFSKESNGLLRDYLQTDINNNMDVNKNIDQKPMGNLILQRVNIDNDENEAMLPARNSHKQCDEIIEETISENVSKFEESTDKDFFSFFEFEDEADSLGFKDDIEAKHDIERECVETSTTYVETVDLEELFHRYGIIYSAELWLIFVPYRRMPWTQVSVLYKDDVSFGCKISSVTEAKGIVGETKAVSSGELEVDFSVRNQSINVIEEEITFNQVQVDLKEIEFSLFEIPEVNGIHEEDVSKNQDVSIKMKTSGGEINGVESVNGFDNSIHLKDIHRQYREEVISTGNDAQLPPLTGLSKKGFMYKSKERIFTGNDIEGKGAWGSMEKIHYKHTKLISVPETLRRTVSSEVLKVNAVEGEDKLENKEESNQEKECLGSLLISPFQGFGKNLKESNV